MDNVSVIIPAYNAQSFIRSAVESALAQTYPCREVIVVDDGSTDQTGELLSSYGAAIRVIRQFNKGTASACNSGVQAAKGPWIAFLDADDEWLPHKLSAQLDACGRMAISHTDSMCFGESLQAEVRRSSIADLYHGEVVRRLLISNFITKSSVLLRRDVFLEAGGFPLAYEAVEDWPLWIKICATHELGYLPEAVVRYRIHPSSKSMKTRATCAAHVGIIRDSFCRGGVGECHQDLRRPALASSFQINSHYAATSGDWTFAVLCAAKGLSYRPGSSRMWKTLVKAALIPLGVKY